MDNNEQSTKKQAMAAILPGIVRDRGWVVQLDLHSIFPRWRQVVDEDAAAHGKPLKIVKGVLWVEVENSAWLQQLQFRKVMMLESINRTLTRSQINNIRFVLATSDDKPEKDEKRVHFVTPPPEEVRRFEEQVAFIADREAREALVRLWYLSKACVRDEDQVGGDASEK